MADGPLAGKVAIVTGGSRGLGREMALALGEAGAALVVTGASASVALEGTVADLVAGGAEAIALAGDAADPAAAERIVAGALERFGRIDALVNNAGVGMRLISERFNVEPALFWETAPADWRRIVDTNLNGAFYMARAVVPVMLRQKAGTIVNISTSDQTMVRKGYSPYGPSKAALEAASRVWAQDLAGTGVSVNVYLPGGAADTDLLPGGPGKKGADGNLLPAAIMRRGIVWLCAGAGGVTGGRYIARLWDEALPPDEAAAGARTSPVDKPALM